MTTKKKTKVPVAKKTTKRRLGITAAEKFIKRRIVAGTDGGWHLCQGDFGNNTEGCALTMCIGHARVEALYKRISKLNAKNYDKLTKAEEDFLNKDTGEVQLEMARKTLGWSKKQAKDFYTGFDDVVASDDVQSRESGFEALGRRVARWAYERGFLGG